jgi:hypothetical protein
MGRGTIAGGGSNGFYSLTLDVGKEQKTKAMAAFDAELADVNALIEKLQADVNALSEKRAGLLAQVDAAINALAAAMQADPKPTAAELQALTKAAQDAAEPVFKVNAELALAQDGLNGAEAQKVQIQKDRGALESVQAERTVSAWCADLTENATGTVATIEVPGEPQRVLIAPGGRAPVEADGALAARALMSPGQVFWCAAVLPGWQRFKPDYRVGTVIAVNTTNDTAAVTLDEVFSSAQGLNVMNGPLALQNVPVEYLDCNASAFEDGDRVVVQFEDRDWTNPKVIGFVDNPKPCLPRYIYLPIRYYIGSWTVLNTYPLLGSVVEGFEGCGGQLLTSIDPPAGMDAVFDHTFEYRDTGWEQSEPVTGLTVEVAPFVLQTWKHGVEQQFTTPPTPDPTRFVASVAEPYAYEIALSSGGARVRRRTFGNSGSPVTLPTSMNPPDPGDAQFTPPGGWCGVFDVVSGVAHAGRADMSLLGYTMTDEVLLDTTSAAELQAFLGGGWPETATVRRGERTWVYDSAELLLDPTISARAVIRYKRPGLVEDEA